MNDELNYAEMLEIPVETVTVNRKEKKRKPREKELADQVIEEVNDRLESADPAFAESRTIEREARPQRKSSAAKKILFGEFVAVCALLAAIFLTNLFLENSAINTFVRGLFRGQTSVADSRTYSDFTLSPVVHDPIESDITVSDMGVMSFVAQCSVYPPVAGTVESVSGNAETGYSVRIRHSDSFTTIMSGLDIVSASAGDDVRVNIPIGFSDGEGEVRVMFYEGDELITGVKAEGAAISWS